MATGVGAVLNTARVRPGESAVVVGCGGVGQAIILGLELAGAEAIVAVDLSPERLRAGAGAGGDTPRWRAPRASSTTRSRRSAAPRRIEALPGAAGARGGQGIIVGMPAEGVRASIDPFDLADQGKRLVGCNYGSSVPAVDFPRLRRSSTWRTPARARQAGRAPARASTRPRRRWTTCATLSAGARCWSHEHGTVRIGARLRHAREAGRLSLADVEARTGVSKGFLSKVERDASSPSVANLVGDLRRDRAADGRPVRDPAHDADPARRPPSMEACRRPRRSRDTLITPEHERHVTVLETRRRADGGSGGDELYTMPSECEVCFVLEGDIEVVLEDETFALGPGDALTFGAAVPHTWRTAGARADPLDPGARPSRPDETRSIDPALTRPTRARAPRYTGIRTFARAPHVTRPEGVDVAIVGVPFDTATSMRPGARFGPAGIRDASLLLRPYNPAQDVDVFGTLVDRRPRRPRDDAGQRRAHRRADRRAAGAGDPRPARSR